MPQGKKHCTLFAVCRPAVACVLKDCLRAKKKLSLLAGGLQCSGSSSLLAPQQQCAPACNDASRRASAAVQLQRSRSACSSVRSSCCSTSVMSSLLQPPQHATRWRLHRTLRSGSACSTATTERGGAQLGGAPGAQPLWRRHLRSRAFRTTLQVILVHLLLWSPYNVYALMKHLNEQWYERMSERANVLKDLQFLITLINPFLYGFRHRMGRRKSANRRANR